MTLWALIFSTFYSVVLADYVDTITYPLTGVYALTGAPISGSPGYSLTCAGDCSSSTSIYYQPNGAIGFYLTRSAATTLDDVALPSVFIMEASDCSFLPVGGAECQITTQIQVVDAATDTADNDSFTSHVTTSTIPASGMSVVPMTITGVTATAPSSASPSITAAPGLVKPLTFGAFVVTLVIPQIGVYSLLATSTYIGTRVGTNTAYAVTCTGDCNMIGSSFTYIASDPSVFEMDATWNAAMTVTYSNTTTFTGVTITSTNLCTYPTPGGELFCTGQYTTAVSDDMIYSTTLADTFSSDEVNYYISNIQPRCPGGGCSPYRLLNNQQIAGVVVGGLALLVIANLVLICLCFRRRRLQSLKRVADEKGVEDQEFKSSSIRHELIGDYDAPTELHAPPNAPPVPVPAVSEFGSKKPRMPGFLVRNSSINAPIPVHTEIEKSPHTDRAESSTSQTLTADRQTPVDSESAAPRTSALMAVREVEQVREADQHKETEANEESEQLHEEYQQVQQRRARLQELMKLEEEEQRIRRQIGRSRSRVVNPPVELDSEPHASNEK
jgi:hypothetical protein